ncbi:MAG: proteasome subunit beta [Nitrospinota bacterium]|nr:MAG: proteasome subunit beta [Nitrospinota bacterium]
MLNLRYQGSSFFELLQTDFAHLLPRYQVEHAALLQREFPLPHGTTILALKYAEGVLLAGDRQATEGFQISDRRIEKVYKADEFSAIAIAGVAGPAIDMVKLFQTELEHYEKIEGEPLALEGKANKLAQMIKQNFPAALHGLVVIPIFAGFDRKKGIGRIYKYDVTGGKYEERNYYATGSGGKDARSTLKKFYRENLSRQEAIRLALEALLDAAEEDVATGGPDLIRGIYPTIQTVTAQGIKEVSVEEIKPICEALIQERKEKE